MKLTVRAYECSFHILIALRSNIQNICIPRRLSMTADNIVGTKV